MGHACFVFACARRTIVRPGNFAEPSVGGSAPRREQEASPGSVARKDIPRSGRSSLAGRRYHRRDPGVATDLRPLHFTPSPRAHYHAHGYCDADGHGDLIVYTLAASLRDADAQSHANPHRQRNSYRHRHANAFWHAYANRDLNPYAAPGYPDADDVPNANGYIDSAATPYKGAGSPN